MLQIGTYPYSERNLKNIEAIKKVINFSYVTNEILKNNNC